jgi:hypothetical protein
MTDVSQTQRAATESPQPSPTTALPSSSTATQKLLLAHDTEVMSAPFALGSKGAAFDHAVPLNVIA